MKSYVYAIMLLLVIVSVSAISLDYRRITFVEDYGDYYANVRFWNNLGEDMEDLHVVVMIDDLGLRFRSTGFDLDDDEELTRRIQMEMPDVASGDYLVRFSISNDDVRKVKYRYLIIP